MNNIHCEIIKTSIDIAKGFNFVSTSTQGGIASFIGTVREFNLGKKVTKVCYDVHQELALNSFNEICKVNLNKYGDILRQFISHYHGCLQVGGVSIAIYVSAPHRSEAFSACRYIIEEIKHKAPIWKQEHYVDGASDWVKGHALCSQ